MPAVSSCVFTAETKSSSVRPASAPSEIATSVSIPFLRTVMVKSMAPESASTGASKAPV